MMKQVEIEEKKLNMLNKLKGYISLNKLIESNAAMQIISNTDHENPVNKVHFPFLMLEMSNKKPVKIERDLHKF